MTVAVSKAAEEGAHALVCASTGNTARRRPLRGPAPGYERSCSCPSRRWRREARPDAMLAPRARAARSFDAALVCRQASRRAARCDAGQLAQPLPRRGPEDGSVRDRRGAGTPTSVYLPYGGGGNTAGVGAGTARAGRQARIVAAEAADRVEPWPRRPYRRPCSRGASGAQRRSCGHAPDTAILQPGKSSLRRGIFCDPSSAAGLAALAADAGRHGRVSSTLTVHGLKDLRPRPRRQLPAAGRSGAERDPGGSRMVLGTRFTMKPCPARTRWAARGLVLASHHPARPVDEPSS